VRYLLTYLRLGPLTEERNFLLHLSNRQQPAWFVERVLRVLVPCSAHSSLVRSLIILKNEQRLGKDPQLVRNPNVERLCGYLVSRHRHATDAQAHSMSQSILVIFASFTEVHEEGKDVLRDSLWVIPSLVTFLMQLSAPLFEEDQTLEDSSEDNQLRLVKTLYYGVHLLWTLVNPSVPVVNLCLKIHQAASVDPQQFNGLLHQFTVALGRLSFADPPDWLSPPGKDAMVKTGELARDLLDTVIEGPDGDSVWEAYQPQTEGEDSLDQQMDVDMYGENE